jgi:hypothetical protein
LTKILYALLVLAVVFLASILYRGIVKSKHEQDLKINRTIRVEVLNGCGVSGIGMKVRNFIIKRGFDVVKVGNARQQDFEETVVLERASETIINAKHFARQFGIKNVGKDIDTSLYLEVTVIVGQDYIRIFRGIEKEL